ncbi:bifunctional adenosylcobinamide kinase/adenosylcobinamide-phosphate guanylyltransferase [Bacillus sp. DJP31]|uniref:bifunctional adenosylcobinamide kinase/adenosylcobinamide-phosphate guanylyltransferase n=1 Tax=Bacillus sp. DJP31 TaxID=3409789 RepID=UPI003BB67A72
MLIFVSGGARSGKSTFAEHLVESNSKSGKLHYIATSRLTDFEMKTRISHHQKSRGNQWITWEQPSDLHKLKDHFTDKDTVLLDCLTILTANELFQDNQLQDKVTTHKKIVHGVKKLLHVKLLVIVSNDLFSNGVPRDKGTFTYMKLLGDLHQEIVYMSDLAYQVTHGIPKEMKWKLLC